MQTMHFNISRGGLTMLWQDNCTRGSPAFLAGVAAGNGREDRGIQEIGIELPCLLAVQLGIRPLRYTPVMFIVTRSCLD